MKAKQLIIILLSLLALKGSLVWSEAPPSGQVILSKVDEVINAPQDQELEATLTLIDKHGNQRERIIKMFQLGSDRRLARFLSPADQKGISVLSLPGEVIYLYLPAFKRTKRIASHVKHNKFAGTDFSYDDMEAKRYTDHYIAKLLSTDADHYVLELLPKDQSSSAYSKLLMWVRRDNYLPVTVEYYDKQGGLYKKMTSQNLDEIGPYWVARIREMHDVVNNHRTKMELNQIRFDSGLSESIFTKRYLERR